MESLFILLIPTVLIGGLLSTMGYAWYASDYGSWKRERVRYVGNLLNAVLTIEGAETEGERSQAERRAQEVKAQLVTHELSRPTVPFYLPWVHLGQRADDQAIAKVIDARLPDSPYRVELLPQRAR